jgi:hypothetical protein
MAYWIDSDMELNQYTESSEDDSYLLCYEDLISTVLLKNTEDVAYEYYDINSLMIINNNKNINDMISSFALDKDKIINICNIVCNKIYNNKDTLIDFNKQCTVINKDITDDQLNILKVLHIINNCKDKTLCRLVIKKVIDIISSSYGVYEIRY